MVSGLRGFLKLPIRLFQEILGFLSVTVQIPLIGLLRGHNFFERLLAQPLGGGEIRVARAGNVVDGLCEGQRTSNQKRGGTDDNCLGF